MKKLPTLSLLVAAFVIGGGVFYFQSIQPVEEVRLYGEAEEASMSESSKSSVLSEETNMLAEIKEESPELVAEESSEKTTNEYDWAKGEKDMGELPSKNLEEQPIPQPDTVGTGLVPVHSEAED
ncbi:MAG: hypothetical protein LBU27_04260 [Candidatus Peribacteria bacterium]|nr:hypothetical protein [Candidatus Peribacteria bacterium]